jgi:hypothetical protein
VSNLDSLVSFAESSQFTPGNSAAFPTGMPLPRTPQAPKPAAGLLVALGGGKKGKKSKQGPPPQGSPARQDKPSKPPEMEQDHQTIGISPAISETFLRNTEFETTVHDMADAAAENEVAPIQILPTGSSPSTPLPPENVDEGSRSGSGEISRQVDDQGDQRQTDKSTRKTSGQPGQHAPIQGYRDVVDRPPERNTARGMRPDLDASNSDLDMMPTMYLIPDPEFCKEKMIRPVTLLLQGAILQVSQLIANAPQNTRHLFPVLTRYFVAKARDFKALNADIIRHRELIRDGEPPVFLHDDHPKMVQMKFRAAKATYCKYRDEENADKDANIQLIKHHMKECMNQFYKVLPQLDMLAAHHNLTLGEESASVGGDDLASLRSEDARQRRGARLDNELRDQIRNNQEYINVQATAQTQGLQRRYDHQERTLNTRQTELDIVYTHSRTETSRRREIEEEMGNLREDLRLSMQENQYLRTWQDNDRPEQSASTATAAAGQSRSGNTVATTINSLPADYGF